MQSLNNTSFKAEVIKLIPLDANQQRNETPKLVFDTGTFSQDLFDFDNLDGRYFKTLFGGEITEIHDGISHLSGGRSPKLRYKIINGSAVPLDYTTAMLFSVYYSFDQIAQNLQTATGISMNEIFSSLGKINILYQPMLSKHLNNNLNVEILLKRNAAYAPIIHSFLLTLPSDFELAPLTGNYQVLTHEFGHAIWDYVFENSLKSSCDRLSNEYSIKGINEGFADFISFVFTGSSNILSNSFVFKNGDEKSRIFTEITFSYNDLKNAKKTNQIDSICKGEFYCLGTLFAKSLYQAQKNTDYTSDQSLSSRSTYAKYIVNALKITRKNMFNLPYFLGETQCNNEEGDFSNFYQNEQVLQSFVTSFLSALNTQNSTFKNNVCNYLRINFWNTIC